RLQRLRPRGVRPRGHRGGAPAVVRGHGRLQPTLGEDAQRRLARPRRPQAQDRDRRAVRARAGHRREARHPDAADEAAGGADARDRGRPPAPGLGEHPRAGVGARRLPARMRFSFEGRSVLVTGAAHGFGREIAHSFARLGATVYGVDVAEEGLAETARLAEPGWALTVERLDVTDREGVRDTVERIVSETGRIDVVVNDAGGVLGQVGRPLEEVPFEDWRAIFAVNLDGAFNTSQAAAPHMKR